MGGASRRDEGGNSEGHIPDSSNVFGEAEATKALLNIQSISSRAVCMHINQLQWIWMSLKSNYVYIKCVHCIL